LPPQPDWKQLTRELLSDNFVTHTLSDFFPKCSRRAGENRK
jgi:hypothetical protein